MAHKLLPIIDNKQPKKSKKITLPNFQGKFGVGVMIGTKEIFFGVTLTDILIEQVVRRKMVKTPKSKTRVLNFNP